MLLLIQCNYSPPRIKSAHLHSTMLLLIHNSLSDIVLIIRHLHSTMLLLIRNRSRYINIRHHIYIPLCFYLYKISAGRPPPGPPFTFHYASTYTDIASLYLDVNRHLHSTMLLLIPIPVYGHTATNFLFTFHYASTYTIYPVVYSLRLNRIYIPLCFYLYCEEFFMDRIF